MANSKEYQGYLRPTDGQEIRYMVCPKCKCRAMEEYWEWHDMPEDKLQCPNCGKEVLIGEWIDGLPEPIAVQKCLMCKGTGNRSSSNSLT